MEHDFYAGIALPIVLGELIKNVEPAWMEQINKDLDVEEAMYRSIRQDEIEFCKNSIVAEEIVGLQLEVEYRARLNEAVVQVKKRLDYQVEVNNILRGIPMEQKHMVDWIISSVKKSITPAQEEAALKKCLVDLKALAS